MGRDFEARALHPVETKSEYPSVMLRAVATESRHFCQDVDGKVNRINATLKALLPSYFPEKVG